ncbi:hypothetical protein [Heyndrickxia faecalis]|uniref:hypothetical protein n=1 Tax=Heyndrickxia faecalis TaxID=2824910 RepID=UPI003D1D91BF
MFPFAWLFHPAERILLQQQGPDRFLKRRFLYNLWENFLRAGLHTLGPCLLRAAGNFHIPAGWWSFSAAAVALALLFPFHLQKFCHMVRLCLTKRIIFWNDCPASVALPASSPCFSLYQQKSTFFSVQPLYKE